ncbi:MAG TPA: hypothetical protein VIV60_04460 [Polyangiaceae bacterium]
MILPLLEAQRRLQSLLGLSPELAARAVAETLDALQLDVDEYIAARHAQLQEQGVANSRIYALIANEIPELRFVVKRLSARQIRRRIYG